VILDPADVLVLVVDAVVKAASEPPEAEANARGLGAVVGVCGAFWLLYGLYARAGARAASEEGSGWNPFQQPNPYREAAKKPAVPSPPLTRAAAVFPYDADRTCPKCGNRANVDRFCRGSFWKRCSVREDHLHIRCIICAARWLMETRDAEGRP
jgi:hypothetical protein